MLIANPEGLKNSPPEVSLKFVEIFKKLQISAPIICDIGSRDGTEGLFLLDKLRGRQLHLFEPNPVAAERCRANIAKHNVNVAFNELAVSDTDGTAVFYAVDLDRSQNRDLGFSSFFLINPKYTKRRKSIVQKPISVRTTTLDSYFAGKDLPDVLWVDVEGAELLVIKGANSVLQNVRLIHIEVSFKAMHCGKPLFHDIDRELQTRGFRFSGFSDVSGLKSFLYRHSLLPNPPWRLNAIYCRK